MSEEHQHIVPRAHDTEERLARLEREQAKLGQEQAKQGTILLEQTRMLTELHQALVKEPLALDDTGLVAQTRRHRETLQTHENLLVEAGDRIDAAEAAIAELQKLPPRVEALEATRKTWADRTWQIASLPVGAIIGALASALFNQLRGH